MLQCILTPTGYCDIADLVVGDEVSAFDIATGAPIVNTIEKIEWVDEAEWRRWHDDGRETIPLFRFIRVNDRWTLNSEQSIWIEYASSSDGAVATHAKHLRIGDIIYDDKDRRIVVLGITELEADGWWRFDISGDHSYICDGLTLHNASRFWFNGTGTWDSSTTTQWGSASNGVGAPASAPGSADTVTFDASSGAGTVTPQFSGFASSIGTFQSITCGAMGMTLDFSANNNSVTLSAAAAMSVTGTGTRTLNMGNGTWTFSATGGTLWDATTTTNMTFNANSSTISLTATAPTGAVRSMILGGNCKVFNDISIAGASSGAKVSFDMSGQGPTFAHFAIAAPNWVRFVPSATTTITNAPTWTGTTSNPIRLGTQAVSTGAATISCAGNISGTWCGLDNLTFAGAGTHTFNSSLSFANVSGATVNVPLATGSVASSGVIGG